MPNEGISYTELRGAECHALLSSDRRRYWHWKQLLGFCRLPSKGDVCKCGDFLITKVKYTKTGNIVFDEMEVVQDWLMLPLDVHRDLKGDPSLFRLCAKHAATKRLEDDSIIAEFGDATILKFNRPIKEVAVILTSINERARLRHLKEQGKEFEKDVD